MNTHRRLLRFALPILCLLGVAIHSASEAANTRVSGTVTDREGRAVTDATVSFEPVDGDGMRVSQQVKKDGKYFFLARAGSYRLAVKTGGGLLLQAVKGRAEGPNQEEVWAVDQAVSASNPPTINVGNSQEITLHLVLGAPAAAAEAPSGSQGPDSAAVLAMVREGRCQEALSSLEKLGREQAEQASVHYLSAYCLQRLDRHEEALAAIDRALTLDPAFVGAHLVRGRSLKALGRSEEAIAALEKEMAQATEARTSLATLYRDLGRTDEAIAVFEQLLEAEPERREYLIELSQLQAKKGNRTESERLLARADAAGGADPAAMLNLAIGHLNEKEYAKTREIVDKLLSRQDLSAEHRSIALSLLARCQLNAGEVEQGTASLEEALRLAPNSSLAAENREILAAIKPK